MKENADGCEAETAREQVSESWVKYMAERVAEDIGEQFDQEYASAADEPKATIDAPAVLAACEAAVWAVVAASEVYNCTEVAQRTYSAEEVEAMMREARPDWFEPPRPSRCPGNVGTPDVPYPCARPAGHSGAHSSHPEAGDEP